VATASAAAGIAAVPVHSLLYLVWLLVVVVVVVVVVVLLLLFSDD
jgi:hypothetical protein